MAHWQSGDLSRVDLLNREVLLSRHALEGLEAIRWNPRAASDELEELRKLHLTFLDFLAILVDLERRPVVKDLEHPDNLG